MQLRIVFGKENLWLSLFNANDCAQTQLGKFPAYFATTGERSVVYFGDNWRKKYFENWSYRDLNTRESDCEYFGNLYDCMNEEGKVCFYKDEEHTAEDLTEAIYLHAFEIANKMGAKITDICFTCLPCWKKDLRKRLKNALEKQLPTQEIKFENLLGQMGLRDYVLGLSYEDNSFELGSYDKGEWNSLYFDPTDGDCRKESVVSDMLKNRKGDMTKDERAFEYRVCLWELKTNNLFDKVQRQRSYNWGHKWLFKEGYADSNVCITIDEYLNSPNIESSVRQLGLTCKMRISSSNANQKNKICFVGEIFKDPILEDVLNKAILDGTSGVCTRTTDDFVESIFNVNWVDRADGDDELVNCKSLNVSLLIPGDLVFLKEQKSNAVPIYEAFKYLGQKQFETVHHSRDRFSRGEKVRITDAVWTLGKTIEIIPLSANASESSTPCPLVEIKAPKRIVNPPPPIGGVPLEPPEPPVPLPDEILDLDALPVGATVTIDARSIHCFRKVSHDQWSIVSSTGSLRSFVGVKVTFDKSAWMIGDLVAMHLENGQKYHTSDMVSFEVVLPAKSTNDSLDLLSLPVGSTLTIDAKSVHCFRKVSETQWSIVSSTGSLRSCVGVKVTFDKTIWDIGDLVAMHLEDGRKYHTSEMTSFEVGSAEANDEGSGFEVI